MLRHLVAVVAGFVSLFVFFVILALVTGNASVGFFLALPLGLIGVPIAVLVLWRPKEDAQVDPRDDGPRSGVALRITQKTLLRSTAFEFLPERLHYTLRDHTGSRQIAVDYLDIAFDISRIESRRVFLFWIGWGMLLAAVIAMEFYLDSSIGARPTFLPTFFYVLSFLAVVYLLAYLWKDKLILLRAGDETLVVLDDSQSKAILDEIDKSRKARYLELLGKRDFAEDKERRDRLIAWLVEKRVLSKQEAGALLTDLETSRVDTGNAVH